MWSNNEKANLYIASIRVNSDKYSLLSIFAKMSDSEYDSEEDGDYIPEAESEEEEAGFSESDANRKRKKNKEGKGQKVKRKKGGIQLEGDRPEDESDNEEIEESGNESETQEVDKQKEEESSKSRVDDLWAAFKRDTAVVRPKTNNVTLASKNNPSSVDVSCINDSKPKTTNTPQASVTKTVPKKVEVTEIFDFAGEEVKVVKIVDASTLNTATCTSKNEEKQKGNSSSSEQKPAVLSKRPSGGLGSVLGKLGKKTKLSTLEKSQLDWHQFKQQEGIEDDLKTSNKDGYLEKQAFLNRVDHKQFEIERDIRQGVRKR